MSATPAQAVAKFRGKITSDQRPGRITDQTHDGEQHAKKKNLKRDMPLRRIDELRKEREKKESGFGIQNIDENPLSENAQEAVAVL